jgi:hypothetical protein
MIQYKTAVLVAAMKMAIYESEGNFCLTLILD